MFVRSFVGLSVTFFVTSLSVAGDSIVYGTNAPCGPQPGLVAPAGALVLSASNGTAMNQSAINSAPAGATIFFKAGTYRDLAIQPKDNQKYIGELGAVLTSDQVMQAFMPTGKGVTVSNLVVDKYRPDIYAASLYGGDKWLINNCEVRFSTSFGVGGGDNAVIKSNLIHHNHKGGIGPDGDGMSVINNEVAYNNWLYEFDAFYEAGGAKFWQVNGLLLEHNTFHNNGGYGIWCDGNCVGVTMQLNWCHNNGLSGIIHEISGQALIQTNLCERNGTWDQIDPNWLEGCGIVIKTSHDVVVQNNRILTNKNGIGCVSLAEDMDPTRGAKNYFGNVKIDTNVIVQGTGRTGVVWDGEDKSNPYDGQVTWTNNRFTLGEGTGFAFKNSNNNTALVLSWKQWRAAGNDKRGFALYSVQ